MQGGSQYILIGILLLSRESRRSLVGFQSEFQYILPGFIRDPASFSWNPGICQSNSQWDPCIFSRDPASFSGNPGTFQSKSCHIPVYFDRDIYWDPASWPGFLKFYPSGIYWDSDWNHPVLYYPRHYSAILWLNTICLFHWQTTSQNYYQSYVSDCCDFKPSPDVLKSAKIACVNYNLSLK